MFICGKWTGGIFGMLIFHTRIKTDEYLETIQTRFWSKTFAD